MGVLIDAIEYANNINQELAKNCIDAALELLGDKPGGYDRLSVKQKDLLSEKLSNKLSESMKGNKVGESIEEKGADERLVFSKYILPKDLILTLNRVSGNNWPCQNSDLNKLYERFQQNDVSAESKEQAVAVLSELYYENFKNKLTDLSSNENIEVADIEPLMKYIRHLSVKERKKIFNECLNEEPLVSNINLCYLITRTFAKNVKDSLQQSDVKLVVSESYEQNLINALDVGNYMMASSITAAATSLLGLEQMKTVLNKISDLKPHNDEQQKFAAFFENLFVRNTVKKLQPEKDIVELLNSGYQVADIEKFVEQLVKIQSQAKSDVDLTRTMIYLLPKVLESNHNTNHILSNKLIDTVLNIEAHEISPEQMSSFSRLPSYPASFWQMAIDADIGKVKPYMKQLGQLRNHYINTIVQHKKEVGQIELEIFALQGIDPGMLSLKDKHEFKQSIQELRTKVETLNASTTEQLKGLDKMRDILLQRQASDFGIDNTDRFIQAKEAWTSSLTLNGEQCKGQISSLLKDSTEMLNDLSQPFEESKQEIVVKPKKAPG